MGYATGASAAATVTDTIITKIVKSSLAAEEAAAASILAAVPSAAVPTPFIEVLNSFLEQRLSSGREKQINDASLCRLMYFTGLHSIGLGWPVCAGLGLEVELA